MAKTAQEQHAVHSAKEGIVREFLEREIPENWDKLDLAARKRFWEGSLKPADCVYKKRDRVCAAEIWCEALGGDMKYFKQADAREINGILGKLDGWERLTNGSRFGFYGLQRGYARVK